jgi:hypothetical protein
MQHLSKTILRTLVPAALLFLSHVACTHNSSPSDAGKGDAGGADRSSPSDTATVPVDVQIVCSENGVTYPVGSVVTRGSGTCPVTCICLESGIIGRCTGACPPGDASPDLASLRDAVVQDRASLLDAAGQDRASLQEAAGQDEVGGVDTGVSGDTAIVPVDAQVMCHANGATYAVGDTINSGDRNCPTKCMCLEGGIIGNCTGGCPPADAGRDLPTLPDGVGKNDSGSADAEVPRDTAISPPDAPVTCTQNGVTYAVGEVTSRGNVAPGLCYYCVCMSNGMIACTDQACPSVDARSGDASPAELCTATRGQIGSAVCCNSAADFPNSCLTGICGCALSSSHSVAICSCNNGCFLPGYGCVGPAGMCTVGADETCNDSPNVSSLRGHCVENGRCMCYAWLATTGKCW